MPDCNWSRWESLGVRDDGTETILKGHRAGAACDHWNLFEQVRG